MSVFATFLKYRRLIQNISRDAAERHRKRISIYLNSFRCTIKVLRHQRISFNEFDGILRAYLSIHLANARLALLPCAENEETATVILI